MESSTSQRVELPFAFEEADMEHLVNLIADMLERLMAHNDRVPLLPESLTRFHSRSSPAISVLDYLKRIVQYTNAEKSCMLITLHYIDQICACTPLFVLSSLTCHRFVIASVTVSSKFHCDTFSTNSRYARVGGISVTELNTLEREFLKAIDWKLTCSRDILQEYYVNLVRTHSKGMYTLPDFSSSSSMGSSSDDGSDAEDVVMTSRPPSPTHDVAVVPGMRAPKRPSALEASAILVDPVAISQEARRPTIEQNMAFAELRNAHNAVNPDRDK
ncbi:cyclin-domain-containing protein [Schizophyllum amplum]|uniref:Cyclin-domain-containing protein n=1 Tax=Schizophyllum amplum TaxID=97359 RepID=A0A550CY75_9AGAR|nr:cyclin-domain-containing protein [Auriculariopsis ampla]